MITVSKKDEHDRITWQYIGEVLARDAKAVIIEARFNRPDLPFQGIILKQGDRFIETFYTDRWYNIFEIHDRDNDAIKGWYCNIACPVVWDAADMLSYVDLALDLWVTPAGVQVVLDEDEFAQAELDASTRARALQAMTELQALFTSQGFSAAIPQE
jgi:predicted RNA-binding protein associated with RNAse of E/G family